MATGTVENKKNYLTTDTKRIIVKMKDSIMYYTTIVYNLVDVIKFKEKFYKIIENENYAIFRSVNLYSRTRFLH